MLPDRHGTGASERRPGSVHPTCQGRWTWSGPVCALARLGPARLQSLGRLDVSLETNASTWRVRLRAPLGARPAPRRHGTTISISFAAIGPSARACTTDAHPRCAHPANWLRQDRSARGPAPPPPRPVPLPSPRACPHSTPMHLLRSRPAPRPVYLRDSRRTSFMTTRMHLIQVGVAMRADLRSAAIASPATHARVPGVALSPWLAWLMCWTTGTRWRGVRRPSWRTGSVSRLPPQIAALVHRVETAQLMSPTIAQPTKSASSCIKSSLAILCPGWQSDTARRYLHCAESMDFGTAI